MDLILKTFAALAFIAYLGVLAFRVPHLDLIVLLVVASGFLIYDFFLRAIVVRRLRG